MKHGQAVLFYSVTAIFVATAVVTLLGVTGGLIIQDRYLNVLFGALIVELVAAVVGLFRGTDWFGSSQLTLAEPVSGEWWQVLKQVDAQDDGKDRDVSSQNAVSMVTIFYSEREQQDKLEGLSFDAEGGPWAEFWSVAASLNAVEEHLCSGKGIIRPVTKTSREGGNPVHAFLEGTGETGPEHGLVHPG